MLLGSILLALAWAALQGEMTLTNLIVGYGVGYGSATHHRAQVVATLRGHGVDVPPTDYIFYKRSRNG